MKPSHLSDIYIISFILIVLFNLSSWMDINAVYAELPLLVNRTPESWELPSYNAIILNCCKLSAIAYLVLKHIFKDKIPEVPLIFAITGCGTASVFTLGFVWDQTVRIAEKPYSLPLMTLVAVLGLVDALSNVVFLPYMAHFRGEYMSAFFIGAGLNQILPALFSILQGVGEHPDCINQTLTVSNYSTMLNLTVLVPVYPEPRFSIRIFFVIISLFMAASGVSFALLHYLPYCQRAQVSHKDLDNESKDPTESDALKVNLDEKIPIPKCNSTSQGRTESYTQAPGLDQVEESQVEKHTTAHTSGSCWEYVFICVAAGWSNCLTYGVAIPFLPYAALPYGDRAYTLALRLAQIINPLSASLTVFYSAASLVTAGILALVATLCTVYILFLATKSPQPPLHEDPAGEVLVVRYTLESILFDSEDVCQI